MALQVLRFELRDRSALTGALAAHVLGHSRPETAAPRPGLEPVLLLLGKRSQQKINEAIAILDSTYRHHRAKPIVEAVIAGPPPYGQTDSWSTEQVQELLDETIRFLTQMLPGAFVYAAAIHQDEGAPHGHIFFLPRTRDLGAISWNRAAAEAVGMKPPGAGAEGRAQQRRIGSAWQDAYFVQVASRLNLGRGQRGSTRRHHAINRVRAAEMRAEEAERLAAACDQDAPSFQAGYEAGYHAGVDQEWSRFEWFVDSLPSRRRAQFWEDWHSWRAQCAAAELRRAAKAGKLEEVWASLDDGVPPDAADDEGKTALMWAANGGHREVVAALLAAGADPAREDWIGSTPAYYAIAGGHVELSDQLEQLADSSAPLHNNA